MENPLRNQSGFISIVALGIFAVLVIFGIIIQLTANSTYRSISNSNNYYAARDVANSVMEHLQHLSKEREAGWNSGKIICKFTADGKEEGLARYCDDLRSLAAGMDLEVEFEVKGHSEMDENLFSSACTDLPAVDPGECYVVPAPGTGNAGNRCELYEPDLGPDGVSEVDAVALTNGLAIDQVDYSCNWGKLEFGSSLSDRVVIPLYYEDEREGLINPFNGDSGPLAEGFYLRMRTPCKPCWYDNGADRANQDVNADGAEDRRDEIPAGFRSCSFQQDPSVCEDDDRYDLDPNNDQSIVQWQISGTCAGDEACGVVGVDHPDLPSIIKANEFLNQGQVVLENLLFAQSTNNQATYKLFDGIKEIIHDSYLNFVTSPILVLFLNEELKDIDDNNIPYLEYQFVTNHPVSNNKRDLHVKITANNNLFQKTISISNNADLIDFAIQN